MSWSVLFVSCVALLMALPLVPAIVEWRRKTDAAPLRVVREYDGKITHFADGFRRFVEANLPSLALDLAPSNIAADVVLKNGTLCQVVAGSAPSFNAKETALKSSQKMLIGLSPLVLPPEFFFESELYAMKGIAGGHSNVFRALLSDADVVLGEDCGLIRWAHAAGTMRFGARSQLFGRLSSDTELQLGVDTAFSRMRAPVIRFGDEAGVPVDLQLAPGASAHVPLAQPAGMLNDGAGRWLVDGDMHVPAASKHVGNLVVRGWLNIGSGSHIVGSVKGGEDLHIEPDTRVDGAVVSTGNVHIGTGCAVKGPVVVEGLLSIESACVIGSLEHPTTITANEVHIAAGAVVHGSIWPREQGLVTATTKTTSHAMPEVA